MGGKWFAPAEGGYHGCSPARVRPTVPPAAARRPAVTPPPAVPQSQYGLDLADPRVVWMPPADPVRHPHDLPDMFRVPMGTVARCSICGATFRLGTAPGGAGYTWTPVRLGG
ncbi:hypothetical protein [Cellulomonas oligotrophica]|uniref:Uncharacterized protein n=1 Tax=Cellulomonas oligotrophica TaxID=931536 RepID=A0A7Y9FI61_9CELL|nr:hypothetical protein [Cellulomonas oligotrophica]NYD87791.1 hypothetical protein [Cellulomonas oligotrophica]